MSAENSISIIGDCAILTGAKAIVNMPTPKPLYAKPPNEPKPFNIEGKGKEYKGIAWWGDDNKLPQTLMEKVYANPIVASAMQFRSLLTFGDGVVITKMEEDGTVKPYRGFKDINQFFADNDVNGYLLEASTDLQFFFKIFPSVIANNESKPKIVQLYHKEAAFSRLEVMNDNGIIENHFYSARWGEEDPPKDLRATPMLSAINPIKDIKYKLGIEKDPLGKVKAVNDREFVIPIDFISPGRFYYPKPYWTSIIESGWYDFAQKIPEFKRALLNNGMVIKYHVELHPEFYNKLYSEKKATTEAEKKTVKTQWLEALNGFLSKPENAGKTFVSTKYQMGTELLSMVTITSLKNEYTGGEYLGDLEEVSNIMSYGMNVHPSIIGSSPGKNKSINGTEARELFIIQQAMVKAYRHKLLYPLYLIKAVNGWPEEAHFTIPNLELTTLDKGTGASKTISQPAIEQTE